MFTLCIAAAAVALQTASAPAAQIPPVNYSVLYDLKSRQTIPVVGARVGSFPHFLSTKLQPEIWALGGVNLSTDKPDLGFAAVLPYKFATNGTLFLGGAVRIENNAPASLGIVAGITFRF